MRIALDAMGTDRHPAVEVEGAVQALRELPDDFTLILVGQRERIEAELDRFPDLPRDRLEVVHATQRIEQGESPATAVRRKPNSSIVVGLELQKEGGADAFVSAGSTGAVMAASLLLLRPLPGVARPPIGTMLPTAAEPVVLVDAGANVDSKPAHLVQFARLGAIYAQDVLRRPNPRVGLLNIGEEPEKGDELAVEAHGLLREQSGLNFVGNIEGRDIITGACDVLVADGFVGNVLLKFYESIAAFFMGILKREQERSGARMDLREIFAALDYTEYGGAPLLGLNGISIICHGGSPPRAIKNAIRVAIRAVSTHMVGHMRRELTTSPTDGGDSIEPTVGRLAEGA
ncbi:MAG TPA: phosphate acyltransferase PlsX [Longimicrobiales bacterium]